MMAIKLDIENVNIRLYHLKMKDVFVKNDDFDVQFASLKNSVGKFNAILSKIIAIH